MDIRQLDLKNERLVLEALAIHCTFLIDSNAEADAQIFCVAENLGKLDASFPKEIFYIQDHGRIVALHWLEVPVRRLGYIRSLWVDPAYRRIGLATQLRTIGEHWFVEQGVQQIETDFNIRSLPMRHLNDQFGYIEKGDKFVKRLAVA